jgi:hypothetical protein
LRRRRNRKAIWIFDWLSLTANRKPLTANRFLME